MPGPAWKQQIDIYVVTADLPGGDYLTKIKQEYPARYVSVGIAEQDLIQVGAGLAMQGKKTICWIRRFFNSTKYSYIVCTIFGWIHIRWLDEILKYS